ncbi:MAG: hypothetical protein ACLFQX_12605 [Candidatus Kapaibacterium sp.]
MTQVENYKNILESIFHKTITFSNDSIENNCIGALNRIDDFHVFRANFIERLKRLNEYFKDSPAIIDEIIKTAKQIAQKKGYKWSGSYSELVALDYWIQFKDLTNIKFPDKNNTATFTDSIARQIGNQEIDLDISLDLTSKRIYSDVKSLIPTHTELVDQILDKLESQFVTKNFLIGIDNIYDVDYLRIKSDYIYELQSGNLIQKLTEAINSLNTSYTHILQSGESANFRISYARDGKNTALQTMREMEPYKLAVDYKYKILDYYEKLLISEPSLITFVANPWFNQELNPFDDFVPTFYRALARRIFMELTKDSTDMGTIYPKLQGKNIKISDVAEIITGIIFINDRSVTKSDGEIYDTFIYLNPNATNKKLSRRDFDILKWSHRIKQPFIDEFYYDNY